MDFEIRMRAGAYKLLVASTKREQILDAAKSLLTCNTRIKAYMTEAQKWKELQDVAESLRSDMVCSYITVAGECVCTHFTQKLYVLETVKVLVKKIFCIFIGLQIHRIEHLARAK